MTYTYKDILNLSEQMEQLLVSGQLEDLPHLLIERQKVFDMLDSDPQIEDGVFIEEILACEERCKALAVEKKKKLQKDMQTTQNSRQLHQAYGRHAALS